MRSATAAVFGRGKFFNPIAYRSDWFDLVAELHSETGIPGAMILSRSRSDPSSSGLFRRNSRVRQDVLNDFFADRLAHNCISPRVRPGSGDDVGPFRTMADDPVMNRRLRF